jgi:hypothetical protein
MLFRATLVPFLAVLLAGCASAPADGAGTGQARQLHERIMRLDAGPSGATYVGFELSALAFVILREDQAMLAFAQQAMQSGKPVYATVPRLQGTKDPAPTPAAANAEHLRSMAVRRLAFTPDPAFAGN